MITLDNIWKICRRKGLKRMLLCIPSLFFLFPAQAQEKAASVTIYPDSVINKISPEIYGQFLEHLYHSVSNGVWGEMVWNRSFEEQLCSGNWSLDKGVLTADANGQQPAWQIYGADNWKDYNIETNARIVSGKGSIVLYAGGGDILKRNKFRIVLSPKGRNSILEMTHNYRWQDGSKSIDTVAVRPGSIPLNTWVYVQVEYREDTIKVRVNGDVLFSYGNTTMPRQGTPGLGAQNGAVQFRDYEVRGANGGKLVEGLMLPARHWYFRGNARVKLDTDALNEKTSVWIQADKGANILGQHHFFIKKDDVVKGSVWLKGYSGKLMIRFVKNGRILAQAFITADSDTWKEYPVSLKPDADDADADLEIVSSGRVSFRIDQVSLMPKSAINTGGFRPDLLKATQALHPAIIRWPGGSFVEHYDFVHGIGPQSKRIGKLRWDDYDPLSFGIDEYMRFCEKTGAQPLIVLPVGYHNFEPYDTSGKSRNYWFQKAMDEMEYCLGSTQTKWGAIRAKNGHPQPYKVKYWELDNEVWKMNPDDYVAVVKRYAPAMRRKYPGITIIACGSGALSGQALALDTAVITKAARYVDMISIHYYEESNRYQSGIDDWKKYVAGLTRLIKSSANPRLKIFWSEWNLMSTDMRSGLYAGALLNEFEKDTMIQMACPALWLRHTSATGWDNAFINFNQQGYFVAPNYLVNKLWNDHFAPDHIAAQKAPDGLNIIATKTEDGRTLYLKVVNASSSDVPLHLDIKDFAMGAVRYEVICAGNLADRNSMEQPNKIAVKDSSVITKGALSSFVVPSYSAGVVIINRDK